MLPYVTFLGREYPTYAVLGLVGFFVAVAVASLRTKRYALSRSEPVYIGAFAGIGLIIGGVLLFGITQAPYLWENRGSLDLGFVPLLQRIFGGMVFYGGVLGSIGGIYLYCLIMKLPFGVAMKLTIPVFPLAHAIMRVGCFSGGCCHGIEYPPPLGIAFTQALGAPNGAPLLPVQLFEAMANLIIFSVLWLYTKKERNWVNLMCLYGVLYSFVRFWLEFLRGDAIRGFVFGLSTSQFISAIVLLACIFLQCRTRYSTTRGRFQF